jgi:hypothetical protein
MIYELTKWDEASPLMCASSLNTISWLRQKANIAHIWKDSFQSGSGVPMCVQQSNYEVIWQVICTQKIKEEWSGTFSGVSEEIFGVSTTCGVSRHFSGLSEESAISQKNKSSNNEIITLAKVLGNLRFKRDPSTHNPRFTSFQAT